MPTETVLALGLTLVSAVAINWGYLLEHRAASGLPPLSVRHPLRTVRVLLGSRAWLFGFLLETSGFILYVLALALAPLALVQSVAAGGIGVLAVLVARISRTRLEPRERVGVGIAIGGLALLAISLAGGSGQGVAGTWYAIGLWLAVSVGAAVAVATFGARPLPGGAAFGLAAGILFAAGDIATKAVVSGGNHLLLGPAMIGFYAGGTMVLQSGFQRGRALTTAGIATLATNAIPIAAAMTLFREPLPSGVLGVTRVAAFASVVIGAVWLSPKRPDTPADEPSTELPAGEPDMADEDGIHVDARRSDLAASAAIHCPPSRRYKLNAVPQRRRDG